MAPDATLFVPLELPLSAASGQTALTVKLLYLTSYEGMGTAQLQCIGHTCSCDEQRLDAHSTSDTRNVSVYREARFEAIGRGHQCLLAVRLSRATSSGGHKFKVRQVTVSARI